MSIISLKPANTQGHESSAQKQTKYCEIKDLKPKMGFQRQNPTL